MSVDYYFGSADGRIVKVTVAGEDTAITHHTREIEAVQAQEEDR